MAEAAAGQGAPARPMTSEHPLLRGRRLYLCTPDRPDLEGFLAACVRGGVDLIQLRDKQLEARPLLARARQAAAVCHDLGVPFVLNDRPDLALWCGADGVHVGQDDATAAEARATVGPGAIVGLSTHAPEQLSSAPPEADYVAVGPVWETPTKPGRAAAGLAYVAHAAAQVRTRPWFAIGGIDPSNVRAVVEAGARRIVVVRALVDAHDPAQAAATLKVALTEAPLGIA